MMGQGSPLRQKLKGDVDELYLDCNGAMLWIKEPTGWKCLGHVVPAEHGGVGAISHPGHPRLEGHPH